MSSDDTDFTGDTFVPGRFAATFFAAPAPPVRWAIAAGTHPGLVRTNNEDHYLVSRRARSHDVLWTNLPGDCVPAFVDEDFVLLVADGIGGEAFGEVASRLVLQSFWELSALASSWVMKLTEISAQQLRERLNAYVERTEELLSAAARNNPRLVGAGTTVVTAHLLGRDVLVSNVGDSRAYICRGDSCRQITRDHTMGQALLDRGIESENIGRLHHVLLNSFSIDSESRAIPDLYYERLNDGDWLLVCTDGLTDMLADDEIAETIQEQPHVQAACDALIRAALDKGGRDNVTLALARLQIPNAPPADADPYG